MIIKINKTIAELRKSGLYDSSQMTAIEYALYNPGINASLLINNANIPGEFMSIYAFLMQNGIPVDNYITQEWHKTEEGQLQLIMMYRQIQKQNKQKKRVKA